MNYPPIRLLRSLPLLKNPWKRIIQLENYDYFANFIRAHKAFITKVSSKICSRYLTWDKDDELSIALIAFNEAIDNFDPV